jgi:hypothetical protein
MGQLKELARQGWIGRAALARPQRQEQLPGPETRQRPHASTTDPQAKLYRKGNSQPAKLY